MWTLGNNSGCQAWRRVSLPTEPFYRARHPVLQSSLSSDTAGHCSQVKPAYSPLRANASPRTKAQKQLLQLAPSSASPPHGRDAALLYKGQQCLQQRIQNRDLVGLPWALQGWGREKQEAHRVVHWQKSWVPGWRQPKEHPLASAWRTGQPPTSEYLVQVG